MRNGIFLAGAAALALSACGGAAEDTSETDVAAEEVAVIPESLAPFGDGYPNAGDPCLKLGESAATSNYLDDSAILVGCPTEAAAEALGGNIVGNVDGVRLVSISLGDANVGMTSPVGENGPAVGAAPAKSAAVKIRGPNSLESKCADKVGRETGAPVIGTNRIEESEAAIAIYINVQGGEEPWRCLAYRDGTIGEVMYTGSEGAL
ncbi:hypothetical protein AMC99_01947 [Altererythrobacter epoxidivorans]|uniref:Uncharacterized protein n=1 Tax=Altererythrobacter epoxidivorans TaxID=361183 RepID=A0A0M4M903_9SPHN|nr:hypothetical protein [Altererythrobacter epoxidivorans]ALE17235.1 hypothetical protein AMC99_01947 [Altererythrobacter epoxidivorans]